MSKVHREWLEEGLWEQSHEDYLANLRNETLVVGKLYTVVTMLGDLALKSVHRLTHQPSESQPTASPE